jgi:hypothetical protein
VAKWKREVELTWQLNLKFPFPASNIIDMCDTDLYHCINALLKIFATLQVSIATPERTFSSFRRFKQVTRPHIKEKRLTGLALMHIHRDIILDIVADRFAKSSKRRVQFVLLLRQLISCAKYSNRRRCRYLSIYLFCKSILTCDRDLEMSEIRSVGDELYSFW